MRGKSAGRDCRGAVHRRHRRSRRGHPAAQNTSHAGRAPGSAGLRRNAAIRPRQLGPGAIVSHGGIDYVVRGSVTFREGPFVWWEHLLEGGDTPTWLSVQEDDGRLELAMWVKRTDLGLQPGGQHVIDGVTFQETERGHAGYTTEGTTGLPAGGEMDYVDCASAGQGADESMLLSFERWAPDMGWEIATGKSVLAGELTVYPAPPVSA
ncbi:conserved hypothetical protein [Mycobacterium tuberculosis 02_1987]|nr:conserved hypothetical protein [Mycobacterium tuberculosis 02_1987]